MLAIESVDSALTRVDKMHLPERHPAMMLLMRNVVTQSTLKIEGDLIGTEIHFVIRSGYYRLSCRLFCNNIIFRNPARNEQKNAETMCMKPRLKCYFMGV